MEDFKNLLKDKYIDKSGDKKFFAIIPYYIINHSCSYEQSLYLVMKRIASEHGTCWASPNTIAKMMKVSANTVRKYREKLIERGWIKKIGEKTSGTTKQTTGEYEITDLWKLNMDFYNQKKVSTSEPSQGKGSTGERKPSTGELKGSTGGNKEETLRRINKKIIKKDKQTFKHKEKTGKEILREMGVDVF